MQNRELVLQKIDAQEREWNAQIIHLRNLVSSFDSAKRTEFEKHIDHLDEKIIKIAERTQDLKNANLQIWVKYEDKIIECWEELVHNVDYIISNYKKLFTQ